MESKMSRHQLTLTFLGSLTVVVFFIVFLVLPFNAESKSRVVIDQLGRQVKLHGNPQRIVALAPSITEIIYALGQEHLLKGATLFSDFPPQAKQLPCVGSYVHLDLEKIISLKPDLCIAIKDGNSRDIVMRLESLGVPVYAVDPRNLDSVMDTITVVGSLLEVPGRAKMLVENMRGRIERVKSLVSTTDQRPGVFFQIGVSPIVSVGTYTFIHELIEFAGGKNLSAGKIPYPRYSREQVLGLSPDVIVITSMARGEVFEKVKAGWSRWSDLPAVRQGRIFLVDSNILDRPTPRMVDGLELLAEIIHPELFGKDRKKP